MYDTLYIVYEYYFNSHTGIIIAPSSLNTSINAIATFSCLALGMHISWLANETTVHDHMHQEWVLDEQQTVLNMSKNEYYGALQVLATVDANNTNITCYVTQLADNPTSDASEPALLLIQGILYRITDILLEDDVARQ